MSEGKIPTLRGGVLVASRVAWRTSKVLQSVSGGAGCASRDVGERDSIRCASKTRRDNGSPHRIRD